MSRGIESGRLPPFSLYRKLKRTTPMPCSWKAFAVASIERSDMLPPAPCAELVHGGRPLRADRHLPLDWAHFVYASGHIHQDGDVATTYVPKASTPAGCMF